MLVSSTRDVRRVTLDNGLTVLVKENHTAPVAAALAHVNVGYFDEPDRWNGLAHVIEHMFFKGTRTRPGKEQVAEEVRAIGGSINAGTYYDETSYYIVVPSANVERAIEIQADTFLESLFDAEELAKEIEVIIQESKQKRDNPGAMALESMYAEAFDRHRIRRWRIGPDEVLRALRRDDLVAFIGQTYRPENIVLAVVGDVDTEAILRQVERCWGAMPRGTLHREPSPQEPPRMEFRFRRMRADIQQKLVEFGFHAPPLLHPDCAPLMVLGSLLSDGRSARLYRALKEEQRLVNSVWAGYEGFADIGVFTMGAETIGDDPLPTERALFEQVGRIAAEPPGEDELLRVKTRIESRRVYGQEEVLGVARNLAAYQSLGDYRLADEMLAQLQAVTPGDVRRAAAEYLRPARATLLEYLPATADVPERPREEVLRALAEAEGPAASAPTVSAAETAPALPTVSALANGATLLYKGRRDLPVVALHVLFPGGKRAETPADAGITNLMLKASLKGTKSYAAAEIAERVESLGSGIGLTLTPDYFGFSMKLLSDRVREGLSILREVISLPTFPPEEVEREKQSIYGEIRRQQDSMSARAIELFSVACFGEQAYGLPPSGIPEAIAALTPDDLRRWHARWTHSAGAVVGVVGDIAEEALLDCLGDLIPAGTAPEAGGPITPLPSGERVAQVARHQTASVLGFAGADAFNDDRHALDVLAEITSGLAGRFFQAVRGDNALAYAVTSFHRARRDAGNFITYTATSPDREEMARDILLTECRRLAAEPVGERELADAKEAIRGEQAISLQGFGAQAAEMTVARLFGRPLDASERYLARVQQVTPRELQEVATRYLTPERYWLGVVRGEE